MKSQLFAKRYSKQPEAAVEIFKKVLKSLLIGTLAGVAIALLTNFFVPDLIDRLEHQSYYMRYYWKYMELGDREEGKKDDEESGIFIVDIDDRTMHKLGNYWNWNRSYHAEMINTLVKHCPAAIVFDINFYDPEDQHHIDRLNDLLQRSEAASEDVRLSDALRASIVSTIDYDRQLVEATANAGVVYNGIRLSDERDYPDHALSQVEHRKTLEWHNALKPSSAVEMKPEVRKKIHYEKEYIDGIFPPLAQASKAIGHLNIPPNSDGVIREIPLLYGFGKNPQVYLPISLRTVASLFATPSGEIEFRPGKYIDIGKPFKVFKDDDGRVSYSYPNVTSSQVKAILSNAEKILALKPNESITLSSYLKIGRQNGEPYAYMHCGWFPRELVDVLAAADMRGVLDMDVGTRRDLSPEISVSRDSDMDWVLSAPYGDEEYWLAKDDLATLGMLDKEEFGGVADGEEKLVFHTFMVKNKDGVLLSSIPVLREQTLRELCALEWGDIAAIKPGTRRDFGKT
ncbi:MAG: CHASE2 domain-containing protein, partial [Chitinivibrionales bacterium]|nr:CHASE2 domain-containing protein [Chitinivibrionales bacterium]MBD3395058.1 CHASE2 domain-containing protein [Chitinivibrionales bacterium]